VHDDPGSLAAASKKELALVIDGQALRSILGQPSLRQHLELLTRQCATVIACRVSPAQKAQMVNLVREHIVPEPITLAIGDGANDVDMICAAGVGIGISGKEGLQAVNASDYSIAQFRFLGRLLLVHGRWNYRRMSMVLLYSFYKNITVALGTFVFSAFCGWSGQTPFDSWCVARSLVPRARVLSSRDALLTSSSCFCILLLFPVSCRLAPA